MSQADNHVFFTAGLEKSRPGGYSKKCCAAAGVFGPFLMIIRRRDERKSDMAIQDKTSRFFFAAVLEKNRLGTIVRDVVAPGRNFERAASFLDRLGSAKVMVKTLTKADMHCCFQPFFFAFGRDILFDNLQYKSIRRIRVFGIEINHIDKTKKSERSNV